MTTFSAPNPFRDHVPDVYDTLADRYDSRYDTAACHAEDAYIRSRLRPSIGYGRRIVDVGCGTGLLADLLPIHDTDYLGIDPSPGMLKRFGWKHPSLIHHLRLGTAEEILPTLTPGSVDLLVALFGPLSYADPATVDLIPDLLVPGGRLFAVMLADGYAPDYHEQPDYAALSASLRAAEKLGEEHGWQVYPWHNYVIVDGAR